MEILVIGWIQNIFNMINPPEKANQSELKIDIGGSNNSKLPISPSNRNASSKSIPLNEDPYLSRYKGEAIPQDRLHKSKARSVKLNQSAKDSRLETTVRVNDNLVTVKEEKVMLNSTANGNQIAGFEEGEYQDKKFKKFSITAMIKEKDLIKESNYFDESHLGDGELQPVVVVEKARVNFRMGAVEQFETFQVKTFLFDRNLAHKVTQ